MYPTLQKRAVKPHKLCTALSTLIRYASTISPCLLIRRPSIHPSIHTSIHIFCNATSIHSLSPLPLHARACVCVCVCHTQVVVAATVVVVVIIGMRNGSRPTEALATPLSISKSCSKQASKQANKQTHMDANSFAGVAGSYFIRTAFGVPFWVKEN